MTLEITPLSEALGAEATGVDWTQPVDPALIAVITESLFGFHVICLRSPPLSAHTFAQVGRYFGDPQTQLLGKHRLQDVPVVSVFESSYVSNASKPEDLGTLRRTGWHTDDSYFRSPAVITMLQALEIPEYGGETRFCNTQAAYNDLCPEMKERLNGLSAIHSYDTVRASARADNRTREEIDNTPDVSHPLVRTHDVTRRKAIYFNSNRTDRVVGLERSGSDRLLDEIHAHMTQKQYQYHHKWRLGDILVWDNRSVTHSVNMDFPVGQKRIHQRILLKGPKPI